MERVRLASWICWAVGLPLKMLRSGTSIDISTQLCAVPRFAGHTAAMWGSGTSVLSVPVAVHLNRS